MCLGILKTGTNVAEKKILHHNFTDAMYNDTLFGYDLFLHDEQIAIHASLTQSKQFDYVNTQGNHVDSDEQEEEEEEDVVNSRWKLPEKVCQRKDLAFELFTNGRVQTGCWNVVFCARPTVLLTVAGAWK